MPVMPATLQLLWLLLWLAVSGAVQGGLLLLFPACIVDASSLPCPQQARDMAREKAERIDARVAELSECLVGGKAVERALGAGGWEGG